MSLQLGRRGIASLLRAASCQQAQCTAASLQGWQLQQSQHDEQSCTCSPICSCQARYFSTDVSSKRQASQPEYTVLASDLQRLKIPLPGAPKLGWGRSKQSDEQADAPASTSATQPARPTGEALAAAGYKLDGEALKVFEKFVGGLTKDGKKSTAQVMTSSWQ
jgi:hypothetical protein